MFENLLQKPWEWAEKKVRACQRARPTLETLEDRTVPIAVQTYTAALLPKILAQTLQGNGATISNLSYTGSTLGAGTFSNGANDVGFASGIVLDTGQVNTIASRPTAATAPTSSNLGQPGDLILANTPGLAGVAAYDDASVINFTLVAQGPQVNLNFVFASNEFLRSPVAPNFVRPGSNDAFIVSVNGTNKALVNGLPITPSTFVNPLTNGLLRNNDPTLLPVGVGPLDVNFNDLTVVLTVSFSVTPGVPVNVHIAIADGGIPFYDPTVDSAVFIGAQSVMTPYKLTASFPTSWTFNPVTQTYIGYVTILNTGPSPLVLGNGGVGGAGTSNLTMQLTNLPAGVATAPPGNTYIVQNTVIGVGQSIRIPVQLTNPLHRALPTYFNSAGISIVLNLNPSF